MIKLWKDGMNFCKKDQVLNDEEISMSCIYPSGRQVLTHAIKLLGLNRGNYIAIPEWSSNCVINAVSHYAMPISMEFAHGYAKKITAVLLYEQWGWMYSRHVLERLYDYFDLKSIILDRVDSANLSLKNTGLSDNIEIYSFSKVLGSKCGGIGRYSDGRYINFEGNDTQSWFMEIPIEHFTEEQNMQYFNMYKNDIHLLNEELENIVKEYSIIKMYKNEMQSRRENLSSVLAFQSLMKWPTWMNQSYESGAAPGIIPLFRNIKDPNVIQRYIYKQYDIETSYYNFNWSGDPLSSLYEKCIAFPIHSQMKNVDIILKELFEKFIDLC